MNQSTKPAAPSGVGVDALVRRKRNIQVQYVWRNNMPGWEASDGVVTARGPTPAEAIQNLRMALSPILVDSA